MFLQVGWLKADTQTILSVQNRVVTHNSRISVTHDQHRTWNLHIKQVKESDRGCYMCQINTRIMKMKVGCIEVYGNYFIYFFSPSFYTLGHHSFAFWHSRFYGCVWHQASLAAITWQENVMYSDCDISEKDFRITCCVSFPSFLVVKLCRSCRQVSMSILFSRKTH